MLPGRAQSRAVGRTGAPHIPSPPGPGGHGPAPAFGQTPWDLVVGLAGHLGLDWEAAAAPRSPPEPLGTRAWLKTQAAGIGPVPQPDPPPPSPGVARLRWCRSARSQRLFPALCGRELLGDSSSVSGSSPRRCAPCWLLPQFPSWFKRGPPGCTSGRGRTHLGMHIWGDACPGDACTRLLVPGPAWIVGPRASRPQPRDAAVAPHGRSFSSPSPAGSPHPGAVPMNNRGCGCLPHANPVSQA